MTTAGRAADILEFMITLKLDSRRVGRRRAAEPTGIRTNPWWTLAGVCIGVIMVGLDASVVAIAKPHIALDLHASLADLQWITDAYMLLAALLIFGGKLGDRFGRRRVFLVGALLALFATRGRDADPV